jgi:protein gp37
MSKNTNIQWCHSTVNSVMGCDGCELWQPVSAIGAQLTDFFAIGYPNNPAVGDLLKHILGDRTTAEVYRDRELLVRQMEHQFSCRMFHEELLDLIRDNCKCYAGVLGTMRAGHPGYADTFDHPKLFPGRMATAAKWGAVTATEKADKPWLLGAPRLIFISDMGDALSRSVSFEFLREEIIRNVTSEPGQRHLWLWLSKRPARMAKFGHWLNDQGDAWPVNLMAMTTVTSQRYAARVDALRRVPAPLKGLSLEPLSERVELDFTGIDWVIAGGGSDSLADVFDVTWALELRAQCQAHGVAFFLKQLGRRPKFGGRLRLQDGHGGDWSEWPEAWRTRELPNKFYQYVARQLAPAAA